MPQQSVIVDVLITQGNPHQPMLQQFSHGEIAGIATPVVSESVDEWLHDAEPLFHLP